MMGANVFKTLLNAFKIEDVRNRILFTLGILAVFRLGAHVPVPGINMDALASFFQRAAGTLLGFYDIFVGGALGRGTIFGLGVMPYISASIIMQLLTATVPFFQRVQQEGEEGRRKLNQYSRYLTIPIAAIQASGVALFFERIAGAVLNPGPGFVLTTIITLITGTMLLTWLGELITDRGIGNGVSIIIMVGILARFPGDMLRMASMIKAGAMPFMSVIFFIAIAIGVTMAVVLITQGQRKIPVQYAQRVIGRKVYGGRSTHIPLNMNAAGIIPIIFAQAILTFPTSMLTFFSGSYAVERISQVFKPGGLLYNILYGGLIIIFAYFYTSIVFNPTEIAENMKKYGGFIPGIRPGQQTAQYIDRVLSRITLPGAVFFAIIAILPMYLMNSLRIPMYFGGTSLLIVVGVILDTVRQLEAHLLMRYYEGFVRRGKIRGRRG